MFPLYAPPDEKSGPLLSGLLRLLTFSFGFVRDLLLTEFLTHSTFYSEKIFSTTIQQVINALLICALKYAFSYIWD
jgi:hypothetical protein